MADGFYGCDGCMAADVKLWRDSGKFFGPIPLRCVDCASAASGTFATEVAEDGSRPHPRYPDERTFIIGDSWIPAVLRSGAKTLTFWSHLICPPEEFAAWQALPLRLNDDTPSSTDPETVGPTP